jgi:hypothetical protein
MKADLVYLQHILDAILKIESYVSVGKQALCRRATGRMRSFGSWKS